jgi:hypothetical protein
LKVNLLNQRILGAGRHRESIFLEYANSVAAGLVDAVIARNVPRRVIPPKVVIAGKNIHYNTVVPRYSAEALASCAEFVLHFGNIPIEELFFGATTNWRQGKMNTRTSINGVCN